MVGGQLGWRGLGNQREEAEEKGEKGGGRNGAFCILYGQLRGGLTSGQAAVADSCWLVRLLGSAAYRRSLWTVETVGVGATYNTKTVCMKL